MKRASDAAGLWALAIPAAAANVLEPLLSLVDTVFVASLGTEAVAALAINSAIFFFVSFVFIFVSDVTTSLVGRATGRGDPTAANRVVSIAALMGLALGVCLALGISLASEPLVGTMSPSQDVTTDAVSYLRIRAWGLPAFTLLLALRGYLTGTKQIYLLLYLTFIAVAANVLLDAWFILGLGLGIEGAALATLASQWLATACAIWAIAVRGARFDATKVEKSDLAPFGAASVPLTIRVVSIGGVFLFATSTAGGLGVVALASHHVVTELWKFFTLLVEGFAVAAQAAVSHTEGVQNRKASKELAERLLRLGLAFGLLLTALLLVTRSSASAIFGGDVAVQTQVFALLGILALAQPLNGLVFVTDGVFVGAGEFWAIACANSFGAVAAFLAIRGFVSTGLGIEGVWYGMLVFMVVRGLIVGWRYRMWASSLA